MSYDARWNNPQSAITLAPTGNNDLPWADYGSVVLTTLAGGVTVTGIVAPVDDRPPLFLMNASGQTVTLNDSDTGSAAANRILTGTGAPVTIANGTLKTLIYDFTNSRWRLT